jgi:hypothetical protein
VGVPQQQADQLPTGKTGGAQDAHLDFLICHRRPKIARWKGGL